MYRKLKLWIVFLLFFPFFFLSSSPRAEAQFAHLDSLSHYCFELSVGYIGFSLEGNPDDYTYYWTDGATTLIRENLLPGIYTLVVRNQYGCEEEYIVEVLDLSTCRFMDTIIYYPQICEAEIIIQVFSGQTPIPEASFKIEWADGNHSGLIRRVRTDTGFEVCYGFTIDIGKCCVINDTICVPPSAACILKPLPWDGIKKDVIVNETRRYTSEGGQFAELLVVGTGICGDFVDLSGFIVDDNNGYIISGNQSVTEEDKEMLGIDEGYLVFSNTPSWKTVPNGSLIVLYGDRAELELDFPADDPQDSNGDGVYVLSVVNTNYFQSRKGQWQQYQRAFSYSGTLEYPSWDHLNISERADGIQVRYPEGEFSHGISAGESDFGQENNFDMWLGQTAMANKNCRLTGNDFHNPADFECVSSDGDTDTPGLANSVENATIIQYLRNCPSNFDSGGSGKAFTENGSRSGSIQNTLRAFPNPFDENLYINLETHNEEKAELKIYDLSGSLIWKQDLILQKGSQDILTETAGRIPSGMLLIEVRFSSGERLHAKVACIR